MGIAFIAAVLGATALILVLTRNGGSYATVASGSRPVSPLDEAERILARRYARAEITAEEYSRMLAILRR